MSKDRTPEELRTAENLIRRLKTWSVRQNFFELNQRERTLIEALCSDAIRTERIRSAEPVTEEQLRKNDGYIHVGNGCEIAVRGTTEKLKALESCLQSQAEVMEKMREGIQHLCSVVATVNHGEHHEIRVPDDDEPVLPQRKEWVEYLLEENRKVHDLLSIALVASRLEKKDNPHA